MNFGSVVNASSTSDLNVVCPLPRNLPNGGISGSSTVTFLDRHPTLNVSCDLRAETFSSTGALNETSSLVNSSGIPNGSQVVASRSVGNSDSSDKYFYFFCNIPRTSNGAKSGIISFQITEQ